MKRQAYPLFTLIVIILAACQPASPEAPPVSPTASEAAVEAVSLIPASVEEVEIVATNFFQDMFGVWRVVGLLANRSDQPIGAIALDIEYRDSSGEVLAREMDYSVAASIAPGQTVPFSSRPSEELSAVGEVNITVAEVYLIDVVPVQLDLVSEGMQIRHDGIVQVTGEIINPSTDTVMLERIAAAVFSSEGEPLLSGESDAGPRLLAPGEQAPFRIFLFGNPQATGAVEHQVYLSAIRSEGVPSFEVTFLEGEYTYVNQLGQFHIVGEVQNSGDSPIDIRLLCGLYNSDGEVIDVVSYDVMPASLGSGEIAPFDIVFRSNNPDTPIDATSVTWSLQIDSFLTRFVDHASFELASTDEIVNIVEGWAMFSGRAVNDTGEPIGAALVVAGLRDQATGQLVAVGYQLIVENLMDGDSTDYRLVVPYDTALASAALEEFVLVRAR